VTDNHATIERIATALEQISAALAVIATNTAAKPAPVAVQPSGPGLYRTVAAPRDNVVAR